MDAFAWAEEATGKLKTGFGERLRFVGIQGSRARARRARTATSTSWCCSTTWTPVISCATALSCSRCRAANSPAGSSDPSACSPHGRATRSSSSTTIRTPSSARSPMSVRSRRQTPWRRRGSGIGDLPRDLPRLRLRRRRRRRHPGIALQRCVLHAAGIAVRRTGAYPRTKAELAAQLEGDEARILEVGRDWQAHRPKRRR